MGKFFASATYEINSKNGPSMDEEKSEPADEVFGIGQMFFGPG